MSRQIVIYAARDLQQAHLLKNELQRYGIRAMVTNEALSRGFGVECPSWGTLPRVIVDEKDAVVARQIALSHDKEGAQTIESQLPEPSHFEERPQAWPHCPECGAPRPTRCPICKTTGTDFPESDPDYAWGFGLEEVDDGQQASSPACSCGSGGCSGSHQGQEGAATSIPPMDETHEGSPDEEDHERPFVLRCTMCDEPFSPEFPNRCNWCGAEFEDGYEVDPFHEHPLEESPVRISLAVFGLAVVGILVLWFVMR